MKKNSKTSELVRKKLYLNTNIMINDNKIIELESCKKVLEYNDIYIKVKTSTLILQIWGKELKIDDFNTDGIIIRGEISSIEFLKK